ncbi:MAG: hypothetical protein ACE5EF_10680, partial [Dehalococcoidia bacterium]
MFQTNPFVEVAVNSGQPSRRPFTYRVPADYDVAAGHAVFVPFGTRELHGLVLGPADEPDGFEARDINGLASAEPVLDQLHIDLGRWMSDRYLAPLWD